MTVGGFSMVSVRKMKYIGPRISRSSTRADRNMPRIAMAASTTAAPIRVAGRNGCRKPLAAAPKSIASVAYTRSAVAVPAPAAAA